MTYRVYLDAPRARDRASQAIYQAPPGALVEVRAEPRSSAQNRLMWALLGEVSAQMNAKAGTSWHKQGFTQEDWKVIFMHSLGMETRMAPGLDGGFVPLGRRSSRLSRDEMSDLIELIRAFGAKHELDLKVKEPEA